MVDMYRHSGNILGFFLFAVFVFFPGTVFPGEFNIKFGTGVTAAVSSTDKMGGEAIVRPPFILGLGYTIEDRLQLMIEGQYVLIIEGFGVSVIGAYRFPAIITTPEIRPYVLIGAGWGAVAFYNENYFQRGEGDGDVSGWYQLHVGAGLDFSVLEWLDLGCEFRVRIGIPQNPDVVSLRFFGTATFRFPLSIKLHKRE